MTAAKKAPAKAKAAPKVSDEPAPVAAVVEALAVVEHEASFAVDGGSVVVSIGDRSARVVGEGVLAAKRHFDRAAGNT